MSDDERREDEVRDEGDEGDCEYRADSLVILEGIEGIEVMRVWPTMYISDCGLQGFFGL